MSRALFLSILALAVGLLCLSGSRVNAQDCERVIPGNVQSPCKQLDYLDGIQAPAFIVNQVADDGGKYACQGYLEFESNTPLRDHSWIGVLESNVHLDYCRDCWNWGGDGHLYHKHRNLLLGGLHKGATVGGKNEDRVRRAVGSTVYLTSSIAQSVKIEPYLVVAVSLGSSLSSLERYAIISDTFQRPKEVLDYQLLMNQCLAGITRQLEHDAAAEAARRQAEEDRVRAETAAEEAKNKAELAGIELRSAQDALKAQESLNASLLQDTILSIKREDAIRAAWQQVILVRMAGLEERTAIWNEAVNRWAEEDLQFSAAMEARIQEVERLQTLNAALERSMAEQRRLLIAKLEDLEKAEQEAQENRTRSDSN